MQLEGGASNQAAIEAARQAAAEAARKAAEEAARKAAEAAARKAAEAAARQAAEAKKDKAEASGHNKLKEAVKAAKEGGDDAMPWEKAVDTAKDVGKGFLGGGIFGAVKAFTDKFVAADNKKTDAFLKDQGKAFSADGQKDLEGLAKDGKLGAIDKEWGNLRDTLDGFLNGGGDAHAAEAVVSQIANPEAITQTNEATCAAATAQKVMAESNPAQYLQVATELLAKGEATLPNGQSLKVSEENKKFVESKEMSLPEKVNALFQAAAMDLGNKGDKYNLQEDRSHGKTENGTVEYRGLSPDQAKTVNDALLGSPTIDGGKLNDYLGAEIDKANKDDRKVTVEGLINQYVKDQFDAAKDAGSPGVFITIHSGTERTDHHFGDEPIKKYHMVMIKDIDDQGTVTMLDAAGAEMKMPKEQFWNVVAMDNADAQYGGVGEITNTATTTSVGATRTPTRR